MVWWCGCWWCGRAPKYPHGVRFVHSSFIVQHSLPWHSVGDPKQRKFYYYVWIFFFFFLAVSNILQKFLNRRT